MDRKVQDSIYYNQLRMSSQEIEELDSKYPTYSSEFNIPTFKSLDISNSNDGVIYLCGNSLGLMPKSTRKAINDELDAWSSRGVESHFNHPDEKLTCWMNIDLPVVPQLAPIIGGLENEVAIMGSLTSNLNALIIAFYKPQGNKTKILFEKNSFPSDYYAIYNQIKLKGLNPEENIIQIEPRKNEYYIRTEDILRIIEDQKDEIALVMLPGIQYYTGQLFDIAQITKVSKELGLVIGWDLAHAVGNVELELHNWGVDFATWCSYKYLNSGPGGISGIFIHEVHGNNKQDEYIPRLAGWWGNDSSKRFQMLENFEPIKGALGFRQSNPSVIDVVSLKTSLEIFTKAGGIKPLRLKSIELTNLLEKLLKKSKYYVTPIESFQLSSKDKKFTIITPQDSNQRGAQLSLLFFPQCSEDKEGLMGQIFEKLRKGGVIGDERRPDVIRLAPIPLYTEFKDVVKAVEVLNNAFEQI